MYSFKISQPHRLISSDPIVREDLKAKLPDCDIITFEQMQSIVPHADLKYTRQDDARRFAKKKCSEIREYLNIPYKLKVEFYSDDMFLTSDWL